MIQFVAFDLGGVLVDVQLEHLAHSLRQPASAIEAAFFGDNRHDAFSTGAVSAAEFFQDAARILRVSETEARAAWSGVVSPYPDAHDLLCSLTRPFVAWSNTDPVHIETLAPSLPSMLLGASRSLSYELGANKPAPQFFQRALAQLQWAPHEILYVDDRLDNVQAALTFGIAAHQVQGLEECVSLLHQMDLLPSSFRLAVDSP